MFQKEERRFLTTFHGASSTFLILDPDISREVHRSRSVSVVQHLRIRFPRNSRRVEAIEAPSGILKR